MENITLKEIKSKKINLEENILKLLKDFETKTGMQCESVCLDRIHLKGAGEGSAGVLKRMEVLTSVKVDVVL